MKRINRLIEQLKKDNIDSIFITSKENLFYYTGIYAEAHERLLALYVTVDEQILLICPALERNSVTQSGFSGAVVSYDDHEDPWKIFKEAVSSDVSVDVSVVAIEKD